MDEFGIGFPPRIWAKKKGETEYSVNWLPFGGFVRISGERGEFAMVEDDPIGAADKDAAPKTDDSRLFYAQPAWKKSVIVVAGIIVNFFVGWLLVSAVLMVGTPKALIITGVEAGSPAAQVGIASGDVVENFTDSQSFISFIDAHRGMPTAIAVLRNGKEIYLTVTPRVNVGPNEGPIGVALADGGTVREPFFQALWDGLRTSFILAGMIFQVLWQLIRDLFAHGALLAVLWDRSVSSVPPRKRERSARSISSSFSGSSRSILPS